MLVSAASVIPKSNEVSNDVFVLGPRPSARPKWLFSAPGHDLSDKEKARNTT
jgi:hypothetical protein